jgi:hypothetical protein
LINFNGVNLSQIEIEEKSKFYCDYPNEENYNPNEITYCYEINNLILVNQNNNIIKINFLFFPYEKNKINNISTEIN